MMNKPPGLPFLVVFSAAAVVLLEWASYPSGFGFEFFVYAVSAGFVLFVYWTLRITWADYKGNAADGLVNRTIMPWYIAIAVVLALVADVPFWVRFTISESSLKDRWYGYRWYDKW
jgi:hypothetical protein